MRKKALAVAIAGAMMAPMAAQAVEVEFSGHVNRAIRFLDTGPSSDVQHVDGVPSQSRIRWTGSQDMGNGMKAGVQWEMGFSSNGSNTHLPKGLADTGAAFNERHQNIWFSGDFGRISLGQGSMAGDGAVERDVNGTNLIDYSAGQTWANDVTFRTAGGGTSGVKVDAAMSNFDPGRIDRLRYDSPVLGPGVTLGAAIANDNNWAAEVSVRTSFAGGKLDGAFFYLRDASGAGATGGFEDWGGSISFGFSQGTGITLAYSERDFDLAGATDPDNFHVKIGHKFGQHTLHLGYTSTDDLAAAGDDATAWSAGWIYSIPKPKVNFYAMYKTWDLDRTGLATQDIDMFIVGSRVRF